MVRVYTKVHSVCTKVYRACVSFYIRKAKGGMNRVWRFSDYGRLDLFSEDFIGSALILSDHAGLCRILLDYFRLSKEIMDKS